MDNLLDWLQKIYAEDFCNGSWEHTHGIDIKTFDPGWDFKFDLRDTDIVAIQFTEVFEKRKENDWFRCKIEDGVFHGWGGPNNLVDILMVFKEWYTSAAKIAERSTNE